MTSRKLTWFAFIMRLKILDGAILDWLQVFQRSSIRKNEKLVYLKYFGYLEGISGTCKSREFIFSFRKIILFAFFRRIVGFMHCWGITNKIWTLHALVLTSRLANYANSRFIGGRRGLGGIVKENQKLEFFPYSGIAKFKSTCKKLNWITEWKI